jgi:hypothetical protein
MFRSSSKIRENMGLFFRLPGKTMFSSLNPEELINSNKT